MEYDVIHVVEAKIGPGLNWGFIAGLAAAIVLIAIIFVLAFQKPKRRE